MKSQTIPFSRKPRVDPVGRVRQRVLELDGFLCGIVFVTALVFGGATVKGNFADSIVESISLPLLFIGLLRVKNLYKYGGATAILAFILILIIPIVQLFPISGSVWRLLPGHDVALSILQTAQVARAHFTVSLSTWATERSALCLVPPIAVYLGFLSMSPQRRRNIWLVAALVGVICVIHEALQVVDGFGSGTQMRSYGGQTNDLGIFFTNRNHLAAFLYSLIPISTFLYVSQTGPIKRIAWIFYLVFNIIIIIGLAMTMSRSALALGVLGWGFSYKSILRRRIVAAGAPSIVQILGGLVALLLVIGLALSFGLDVILTRLADSGASDQTRWVLNRLSLSLIRIFWPLGSGLGTFERVFPIVQNNDTMFPAIANHAHNDFMELIVETGVFGAATVILIYWTAIRSATRISEGSETILRQEGVAAVIIVILLSLHSIWDYPLRTCALSVIFAAACAAITVAGSPLFGAGAHSSQPGRLPKPLGKSAID